MSSQELFSQPAISSSIPSTKADNNLPSDYARRGRGWKSRGTGGRYNSRGVEGNDVIGKKPKPSRPRPTHFLSLPLHDHPELRNRVSAFQTALLGDNMAEPSTSIAPPPPTKKGKGKPSPRISTVIEGLDTSILIDPRRLHMTLGVMALEPDVPSPSASEVLIPDSCPTNGDMAVTDSVSCDPSKSEAIPKEIIAEEVSVADNPSRPRKTVASALELLTSLKPSISDILLGSSGVDVPLEILNVFDTRRMRGGPSIKPADAINEDPTIPIEQSDIPDDKEGIDEIVGAGVLFLGPREGRPQNDDERSKLERVSELIYQAFKKEGYLTDTRPLTLHCTILNASHRKPRRRIPFSYSDILASPACQLLGADPATCIPPKSESQDEQQRQRSGDATATEVLEPSLAVTSACSTNLLNDAVETTPKYRPALKVPPPLPVDLGTYRVREVQLWEMGSRGPNNEYVSHGGIVLD
ncbi:hypothetical protein M413DRAFT_31091 [Hebeloma cylindrosporum]|uniref:A-kinase anchor protein 7-like phosphoesterase domain-containing protein n=1 Tax=Hebeloma cylindrosporum TaxID=76867 RepID=A0A0C2Y830_HEBCY|nr:hypothetical protein M413DRAFT_31091 [Hebeloma cylindrosporum h7]